MDTLDIAGKDYVLATLGERLLAQVLDGLIYFAIAVVPMVVLFPVGGAVGVVVALLYLLFQDGLRRGQSYGKRVTRTAVVDAETGQWCSFWQSFLRNLLLAIIGFIDWLFIFGARRQRLGDKLANTVVVKLDDVAGEPLVAGVSPLAGGSQAAATP